MFGTVNSIFPPKRILAKSTVPYLGHFLFLFSFAPTHPFNAKKPNIICPKVAFGHIFVRSDLQRIPAMGSSSYLPNSPTSPKIKRN